MSQNIRLEARVIEYLAQILDLKKYNVPANIIQNFIYGLNDINEAAIRSKNKAYEKGFFEGERDPMTGLPRRRGLQRAFDTSALVDRRHPENGKKYALVFDMIGLGGINNDPSLGQNIGDRALVALSKVLQSVVRQDDICARIGGDEFVIILPETTSEFVQKTMPERITHAHGLLGHIPSSKGMLPIDFRYTTIELPEGAKYDQIIELLDPKNHPSKRILSHNMRLGYSAPKQPAPGMAA